jgi:hypothetical protein
VQDQDAYESEDRRRDRVRYQQVNQIGRIRYMAPPAMNAEAKKHNPLDCDQHGDRDYKRIYSRSRENKVMA